MATHSVSRMLWENAIASGAVAWSVPTLSLRRLPNAIVSISYVAYEGPAWPTSSSEEFPAFRVRPSMSLAKPAL